MPFPPLPPSDAAELPRPARGLRVWLPLAAASFSALAILALIFHGYPNASVGVARLSLLAGSALALSGGVVCLRVAIGVRTHVRRLRAEAAASEAARLRAEAGDRAKLRFLAAVSHEIRTPMNGVIGMTSLLFDTKLTAEQRSYLTAIDSSSRALVSIIDEILDVAKLESTEIRLDRKPFDLLETLEGVGELMAPRAHAKGIEIALHVSRRLPRMLTGDASRLRQVLFNLVGNAIKFTDRGGVLVRAERTDGVDGTFGVSFVVSDTGIGMSDGETRQVFERFAQASEETARRYGGHGLGLSISRDLVRRMGGDIACRSMPGRGSEFSFTLPCGSADCENSGNAESLDGRRISLALPEGPTRTAVAAMLEDLGAAAEVVDEASQVIAVLTSLDDGCFAGHDILIDAVYADVLRTWLAGRHAAWSCPRVWLLLAPEQRRLFQDLMASPHVGYLLKPVRRSSLVQLLIDRDAMRLSQVIAGLRAKAAIASRGRDASLHVLLAEDDPVSARLAAAMLEKSGHRVSHVANGRLALEFALSSADPPDLVLMDMEMPDTGGLTAARAIRAAEAEERRSAVPIIALTANTGAEHGAGCLAAGMNGFLAKPFDRADLDEAIARLTHRPAA